MPFFETDSVKLHYYKYGYGPEVMLAFHGFGMKGTQFRVLEPALKALYTVYSFDIFFHGETTLYDASLSNVKKGLSAVEFGNHIREFMYAMNFSKFSLLSYSMGSLMAFSLIQQMPECINTVFLIAPDGIKPNKLLQFGARNKLINKLFYKLVYSPKTVHFLLDSLLRFKYIDNSLHKILLGEFISETTRLTCYNAITYYGKLSFNQDELVHLLNSYLIRSYLYFGEKDQLFPPSIGHEFIAKLNNTSMQVLQTGHELVNSELNNLIAQQLTANQ